MSRHSRIFRHWSGRAGWLIAPLLAAALLVPPAATAGVIAVDRDTYRLDGGKPVTGMWEIAERIAYAKDAAIVVMEPKSSATLVQNLLQLLEGLKVPTLLLKRADYQALVDRGVLRPTTTP